MVWSVYLEGMKIPRSLRADIRRTYSEPFGLVANPGTPSDAQARWSRFREAAKDLVTADTLAALEAAWTATEHQASAPEKVDPAPVENAPFKIGDRVRIVHPQPRPFRQAPPLGWEGRIGNYLPYTLDPFWVFDGGPTPGTGWWCAANELELVSEPPPFKVGDRVRVARMVSDGRFGGWVSDMNDTIGQSGYIAETREDEYRVSLPDDNQGWWYPPAALERVTEPAPVRPFKVGDRVRVIKSDLEEVDQLEVGSEGSITGCNHEGDTPNERKACWRVQTSEGRWSYGWHVDDDLELINS